MIRPASERRSLPEVHASVDPARSLSLWKRLFAFAGPAYLVSVGYMDPGNWATDLEGGARFGYQLLWVLVLSNAMAVLLQTLSARLGIVAGRDLAQACRDSYPKLIVWALWLLCEVAIAACDLAEVLGAAIALNLLFGIPLLFGVILTAADTLLILWLTRFGIRLIEALILVLVGTIGVCFGIEILMAKPVWSEVASGLVPRLSNESLYVAIGILGATVMPHNLYLHSALVQTRRIGESVSEKAAACRFNLIDSVVALNAALFVNAAILIMAASVFFKNGVAVNEIQQAHQMLAPLLGATMASVLFAVALLCAGQSSTLTGTLAGQIVMEGFVNLRLRPWLRRVITRLLAIIPAVVVISISGEKATYQLLILSQVILSLQLPFAVIPLIHFTSDRERMGSFANPAWVRVLAWVAATIIVGLNVRLVLQQYESWPPLLQIIAAPFGLGLFALLGWMTFRPILPTWARRQEAGRPGGMVADAPAEPLPLPTYRSILVPLDHSTRDRAALAHAAQFARTHGATLHLFHVEEDATSAVYGPEARTAEVEQGLVYLESLKRQLELDSKRVTVEVRASQSPGDAIVRYARELNPDLVVMAAHGHRGLKDLALGQTIDSVRHSLRVPVLIVTD